MRVKVPLYLPSIALPLYKSLIYPLSPGVFAFAGISLMSGGDFSSLCPVSERMTGLSFCEIQNHLKALFI